MGSGKRISQRKVPRIDPAPTFSFSLMVSLVFSNDQFGRVTASSKDDNAEDQSFHYASYHDEHDDEYKNISAWIPTISSPYWERWKLGYSLKFLKQCNIRPFGIHDRFFCCHECTARCTARSGSCSDQS